ncbi:DNA/RNA helicase domain-containing protein [Amycolatopsis coloradensis]|uniref:DNA/RNA helicase domain-containing protein n=1 Tax=Amycolatopsis coloradensis TaxID=76021 RepID=A0ACD5BAE4_9PSEU
MRKTAAELRVALGEESFIATLAIHARVGYSASTRSGEVGSWRRGLPVLAETLCVIGLEHVEVFLEYRLPFSPKRVDAILCGVHPETGQPSYVLVELKQWRHMELVGEGLVKTSDDDAQPVLHPSEQVRRYCRQLLDFTPQFARAPRLVKGIVYLHDAVYDPTWRMDKTSADGLGRLFAADTKKDLANYLCSLLDTDAGAAAGARDAANALLAARHTPARNLLTTAAGTLEKRDEFVLLDEQQVAYQSVMDALDEADSKGSSGAEKKVVVVSGGPGSGKSAIAITLLASLARHSRRVLHATGSKAFTETLRATVAGIDDRLEEMFKYFNQFGSDRENSLDVLLCDEAHRVRGLPERPRARGREQIDQLIDVAKVPVFLLDEHQVVRPGEVGTRKYIVDIANLKGHEVLDIRLDGQFRCGGSDKFDEWVTRLMFLSPEEPIVWSDLVQGSDDEYVVDAAESPQELESWLRQQSNMRGGSARMTAGFCWDWSDPIEVDGTRRLVDDVKIDEWSRPWNAKPKAPVPGVPSSSLWASDPRGFGQVGCIYSAQGFEYDWAGVIFGDDLVIRDRRWVSNRKPLKDQAVKNAKERDFDRLVRNTYKVLLTRGMQGVCLYSKDPATNRVLRKYAR